MTLSIDLISTQSSNEPVGHAENYTSVPEIHILLIETKIFEINASIYVNIVSDCWEENPIFENVSENVT